MANEELLLVSNDAGSEWLDPRTGEAISVESSDEALISFLAFLRDAHDRIREVERYAGRILLDRMDEQRRWTIGKASAPSPTARGEWDAASLGLVLEGLVAGGRLGRVAAERCFRLKREVVDAGIKAVLAGSTPEEQSAILACRQPSTAPRRVSVKR